MSKRNIATNYTYQRLRQNEEIDGNYDKPDNIEDAEVEFVSERKLKIPWKTLGLSLFLFIGGIFTLFAAIFIMTGHIDSIKYADRFWPLIILGIMMILPGWYNLYMAVISFRKGTFDDFPEYR